MAQAGLGDGRLEVHTNATLGEDGTARFQVRVADQQTGRKRCIAEVAMSDHACLLALDPWRDREETP